MGAPSKEEIAAVIHGAHAAVRSREADALASHVIAHLADENERLRAERIEVLALLERFAETLGYPYYEPSSENRSGWMARLSALLDRRGAP